MTKEELITEAVGILSGDVVDEVGMMSLISRYKDGELKRNPNLVMTLAGNQFGVTVGAMLSPSQERVNVYARGFYTKYMRQQFNKSYASIGKLFGKKHDTMMSCLKTVNNIIESEADFCLKWVTFEEQINKL